MKITLTLNTEDPYEHYLENKNGEALNDFLVNVEILK